MANDQKEPLRQPRTFWQWLTNQPGTIYSESTQALAAIERSIKHIHDELDSYANGDNRGYQSLVEKLGHLHQELIRRSREESSGETVPTRQS